VSLNASSRNLIYTTISQDTFAKRSRDQLIDAVEKKVSDNPEAVAELLINLLKNENLEKTEFSVYKKLFENESLDIRPYRLHRVVLLTLNIFWSDFTEKSVQFDIGDCYDDVLVDFDVLAALFVHLIDNATKYILPESILQVLFTPRKDTVTVRLSMTSMEIKDSEVDKIWLEGYSGENPRALGRHGDGIGLFIVKKLASSIDGKIHVERDIDASKRQSRMGLNFTQNVFSIRLPRAN
jgi:signal transduction histidine kinase